MKRKSGGGKRHIAGRAGRFGLKGPMARQSPSATERPDLGTKTKGRMHWDAKAQ